ncbi:TetR/AcrR family transcriptional regulator [Rhodococcus spelaei]|uniref:TetR/AcrR family transcriptional regulator n=1 Tax=Rhodococcus spelaei TaxID=2546320 RepID=A0A541BPI7_9NOCA|nr:TetR/AcrR family transcriptional regulator [Rhodococcus spelaei]TQF74230.1 TetR/AcrR family transcriptional regulator [Rhodococcus spelaei]
MARQQERARRTRAAIVEAAAVEFARRGYAAASVNTILEGSHATKGAMYFHFESKEDLARAVLASALERYTESTDRWKRVDADPFQVLHGIIVELAERFAAETIVQAEFRLIIEPEFYSEVRSGGSQVWGHTAHELVLRAQREGHLRADADPAVFSRVLGACLAGQRYMLDMTTDSTGLRDRFEEAFEVLLQAMASEEWLAQWRRDGWQDLRAEAAVAAQADAPPVAEAEQLLAPETGSDQSI